REELRHPDSEVRLAAIWALGRLQDDGARELLVTMLRQIDPTLAPPPGGAEESPSSGLMTDAAERCFDTVVQALGRLGPGDEDPFVGRALLEARARVPEEELDRPARLPSPELTPGRPPMSLRFLFESALPASAHEDEIG
ncbi:MAG: HEAT repeat domain-containing protein, partial [Thermoplasmata archaeon]